MFTILLNQCYKIIYLDRVFYNNKMVKYLRKACVIEIVQCYVLMPNRLINSEVGKNQHDEKSMAIKL